MIIKKITESGHRCDYECFDKKTGKMGTCGAPAIVSASGRPVVYLCEECARLVGGTAKAEYRLVEKHINTITGEEIEKEITVRSAVFWDYLKK